METIVISREYYNDHTKGFVYHDKCLIGYSLELPFDDNKREKSCIPEGQYVCQYEYSKKGHVYRLYVTGRTGILIHKGNLLKDTRGCILFGLEHQVASPQIMHSKKGMEYLKKKFGNQFKLIIECSEVY